MAEIIQEDKHKGGKKKPKKHSTAIDMTPMVDLMCLLITFFMLTTAFAKPKVMEIALPEKIKKNEKVEPPKIAESRTLNKADPAALVPLQETNFSATGIRQVLLDRNRALFKKIEAFKGDVIAGKINIKQDSLQSAIRQLKKNDDTGPIVLIKFYKKAKYKNFVDIIDEMSIVGIAIYIVTDLDWLEQNMVERALGIPLTAAAPATAKK
jgi:biopolymer transport protein ExbD